jgi:polysaccharide deacetylase family protein (PEP-CTERM system associated)
MVTAPDRRRHVLTINLEDYFQVGAFQKFVRADQWQRYESRIVHQTKLALDLLDEHGAKATFFVLGRVAEALPGLVRQVAGRGHEVASRGYAWRNVRDLTPLEFRDDLRRGRLAIERACGQRVLGYRTAEGWFRPADLWALDVLAEEGYAYDSSVGPILRTYSAEPRRRFVHQERTKAGPIAELPIASARVLGVDVPIGGGNWLRQLPPFLVRRAVRGWESRTDAPFVMYFHTWELDPDQPRFEATGFLTRVRHYRNLDRMRDKVSEYLKLFRFDTAAAHLGLRLEPSVLTANPTPPPGDLSSLSSDGMRTNRTPVGIVVPLYNEEPVIPFLANTLREVRRAFRKENYDPRFLLVNDASRDKTLEVVRSTFDAWPDVTVLAHETNLGVAAAIMTGLRAADGEIVCSMDADCTYDPHELLNMIPKLTAGVDLVTASPYHPAGEVRNVPRWRLVLSKGASAVYRRVFHNKLYTYTSCFRVYRRSRVVDVPMKHGNFLGVVELLGRLDHGGSTIVEHPAALSLRMLGRSKMKTVRTIFGHLRLMRQFAWDRLRGRTAPADRGPTAPPVAARVAPAMQDRPPPPVPVGR